MFLIPSFWPIFANFQKEADCLSGNSLIDRDPKWLFFMSWSESSLLLSNLSQISKINAMVTFYGSLNVYTFFWLTWYVVSKQHLINSGNIIPSSGNFFSTID